MKESATSTRIAREGGFILATVLVFLVVLSLTAFFAASLTRTDVQVVNNLQNEKEAIYAAEAGINEALFRLGIRGQSNVTISPGPGTFDASLYTRYRAAATPCSAGALSANSSPYGLEACDAFSNIEVLFNSAAPAVSGANVSVPTLQRATYPVKYSTGNSGSSTNLKMEWDRCVSGDVGARYNCIAVDQIRQRSAAPPCSNWRNIVKITSTGEVRRSDGSMVASRTVKVRAVDLGTQGSGNGLGSLLTSNFGCPGIAMNGGASITAAGSVQINAGAPPTFGGSPPASCNSNESTSGGNNNTITACTDSSLTNCSIDISGSRVDGDPTYSPLPQTDKPTIVDPFSNVNPPSLPAGPVPSPVPANSAFSSPSCSGCAGTANAPQISNPDSTVTHLSPGIYWGGLQLNNSVTLDPGLYVMAGGGFNVGGGTPTIIGNGVTFVNTFDPLCPTCTNGNYGAVNALGTGNATVSLVAPTTDPTTNPLTGPDNYGLVGTGMAGFLLYQNRTDSNGNLPNPSISPNQPTCGNPTPLGCINLQGGTNGNYTLDGVIYAWGAPLELQGHANEITNLSLIVGSVALNGNSNITLGEPSTTPPNQTCGGSSYTAIAWQDFCVQEPCP